MVQKNTKIKTGPERNPWNAIVAEIEEALRERDQEKSITLFSKIESDKLMDFVAVKILDMETLAAEIKFVNFILKGRIAKK